MVALVSCNNLHTDLEKLPSILSDISSSLLPARLTAGYNMMHLPQILFHNTCSPVVEVCTDERLHCLGTVPRSGLHFCVPLFMKHVLKQKDTFF
jgi:hypothetical protein